MKKTMSSILKWVGSASLVFAGIMSNAACFILVSQPKCPKSLQK